MTTTTLEDNEVARGAGGRSRPRHLRRHLSIAAALTCVVSVAPLVLVRRHPSPRPHVVADALLGGWLRWDSWWYINIAAHGYTYLPHRMSSVAFFPAYPLAVRALGDVLPGGGPLAAIVLTVTAGAVAIGLFHRWCSTRLSPTATSAATAALALYPFSWFLYGAAYSDALYLALVLGAFLLLDADRPVAAGLVALVATATRPTGITLVIGLLALQAERQGWFVRRERRRVRARDLGVVCSLGGLVAWCAWLWWRFGNPFAFIETEGAPGWDQAPGLHTWLKLGMVHRLHVVDPPEAIAILLQTAAFIAFLVAVPWIWRRFGVGYGVYTLAAVTVPAISTGDFLGEGRYLLAAFPVFAVAGAALADTRPWLRRLAAIASATLLAIGAALFASGYLVA